MTIYGGIIYNTDKEFAAAVATKAELKPLRDAILLAIVSQPDSPVMYREHYCFDELVKLHNAQQRARERKAQHG